jgi:hypothetical protein
VQASHQVIYSSKAGGEEAATKRLKAAKRPPDEK